MLSRRNAFTVALAALVGVAAPALAATKTDPAARFDTDNDGTVELGDKRVPYSRQTPCRSRSASTMAGAPPRAIQDALGIESDDVANYCFPRTWSANREQRAPASLAD
jgi:hypothetical protein